MSDIENKVNDVTKRILKLHNDHVKSMLEGKTISLADVLEITMLPLVNVCASVIVGTKYDIKQNFNQDINLAEVTELLFGNICKRVAMADELLTKDKEVIN